MAGKRGPTKSISRQEFLDGQALPFASKIIRGAVTIPVSLRMTIGWSDGDYIGFALDGKRIELFRCKIVPEKETP
jgi:hypothetical protein